MKSKDTGKPDTGKPDTGKLEPPGITVIEERIDAPARLVAAYIGDFRNAKEWMVGVEEVRHLREDTYKLRLESPVGVLEPEVHVTRRADTEIHWSYASAIEGGGRVSILPDRASGVGCLVSYEGRFQLRGRFAERMARLVGMQRFARKNGERSLSRLKALMEARRY